ncbi:MAG TPA: adenosylmethionine decarboxylase [Termitinemataceae bacterium]|uniref:adenosylmethionine decarboxylase n=1 Tax=Treponema sp. J25 TaxID=2094121 RepID=UPI0010519F9A|nr:adenosylmethionine decarboxylase [Treponema sp. J25]TCW60703.1 adenosylmethionine decarboxylase [Treponema sp. J25]HOJ99174.1 adenosylmethionine decarboxylase [Termitinemataceae bacterium]HOM23189.1 adenosylmethionine decarboxylase [Termitinemataceae bacterium]HPQ00375.1 adenosylmethionine decarboxylase [Termitinemataceae bacterium]
MLKHVRGRKVRLEGFNNLTKSLSFNIYDVCYARSHQSQIEYLEYIDKEYDSERLKNIIEEVTRIIDAKLVSITTQDYDPRGASVVALINEDHPILTPAVTHQSYGSHGVNQIAPPLPEASVVGHLDKSHITAHTYPEFDTATGIATFRVDIDVSTCGMISPLRALHYLIDCFDSDVVLIDYRVRGFTRDTKGQKIFIDHDISSIQDFIDEDILADYLVYDINILSDNIFHTKMRKKEIKLNDYLFGPDIEDLDQEERKRIRDLLKKEMQEIFECENF